MDYINHVSITHSMIYYYTNCMIMMLMYMCSHDNHMQSCFPMLIIKSLSVKFVHQTNSHAGSIAIY